MTVRLASRLPVAVPLALALALGTLGPVQAQGPSPAAPIDLSRPQFDTTTRVYEVGSIIERNAGTVVAEVDGRAITLGNVGDAIKNLPPYLGSQPFEVLYPSVLAHLIRQQSIVLRAQQQALDDDSVVKRRAQAAAEAVIVGEWLQRETSADISEKTLLARYDERFAGKPGPDEVRLRLIQTGTEKEALALIAELKAGADFGTVAQRSSKDATARIGGDLGYTRRSYLNAEVGTAAYLLKPGQMSEYPISSNGDWYIIKVEDRRPGPTPTFSMMREYLTTLMRQERAEAVAKAALDGMTVRTYTIMGKEADAPARK